MKHETVQKVSMRRLVLTALLMSWPISARAIPCEQFTARFLEGAAYYRAVLKFLAMQSEVDPDVRYWTVTMFGDVRSMMSCWHGSVRWFVADANTGEGMASVHLSAMMGIGLYAYALDWREAVEMRNELMRAAKSSDTHQARAMVEDGEASLIISFAGLPSFQIDRK